MPLCRVLLNDDKTWPWLVLVPRREGMVELHDLDEEDQAQLMREMSECAKATRRGWNPTKVNVAAIGCVCRQLHVHVLGRYEGDACWPGPVWGATEPVPYAERDLGVALANLDASSDPHLAAASDDGDGARTVANRIAQGHR